MSVFIDENPVYTNHCITFESWLRHKINVTNICFHIKFVIEKICEGEKMQCIHLHDSFLTFESLFTNEH
jgi:hypothetical protein